MADNQTKSLFTELDEKIDQHKAAKKVKKIKEQQNNSNNTSLF